MKRLCLILSLLSLSTLALAAFDGLPADVQQNLGAIQKYPKAGSILLSVSDRYTLHADGSQSYERHEFRYIPDEAARDNFGDPHIAFQDGRQQLEILTARTYTADGRRIDATPENAFNPIVPEGGLDHAPDFTSFQQMVVTLLGLENGSIAELHYRLTTPRPLFPWLEGRVYFREEAPVISRTLVVNVPEGTKLQYVTDRGAPEPTVTGGTYTWTTGEQAGYLKEDLAGHRVLLPNVAFTTATGWEQVQLALREHFATAAEGELALPASLRDEVEKAGTDEAKLDAIRAWLHERFPDLEEIEYEHPDLVFTLRAVNRVLQSGYGNALEVAMLAAKLAGAAGVQAEVVPCFVPDSPVPYLHETAGAVLAVHAHPHMIYAHPRLPRDEFPGSRLVGCRLLPLNSEQAEPELYAARPKTPALELFVELGGLGADTLQGHGTLSAAGEWGVYEAVRSGDPTAYLEGVLRLKGLDVTAARVRELDSPRHGGSVVVDFDFTATALDTADGHYVLPLAIYDFGALTPGAPLSLSRREFRQEVPMPGRVTLRVQGSAPDGWQAVSMPRSGVESWDFDEARTECEVREGGRLGFTRSLTLANEWILPDNWNRYRAFVLSAGANAKNAVVFAPKDTAAK